VTTAGPARPIRALAAILVLWVGGRSAYLLSETPLPLPAPAGDAKATVVAKGPVAMPAPAPTSASPARLNTAQRIIITWAAQTKGYSPSSSRVQAGETVPLTPVATVHRIDSISTTSFLPAIASVAPTTVPAVSIPALPSPLRTQSKWSGSFWLAARDGPSPGLASGSSQLGGSQAGLRLYRQLTPALSLTGRVSSALGTKQGEASVGIALKNGAFAVLAERRFALNSGGRNDWSVTAVAGVSDVRLPLGLRLDGYAQAGLVGRDGFADGALRVERAIMGEGPNRLSIGAGVWGSVQPGVVRLDVGPQLVAHLSLADRPVRLAAEWRQRVAGNAAPGSGPAITLGTDF
jgi:hypothetical protein